MKQQMAVQVSSEELSWITPPEIIERVRKVLGGYIDLDPASSAEANSIIKANRYYTESDDMFKQDLTCDTIYMNPPFGKVGNKSQAGIFTRHVLSCYTAGKVKYGGIILIMSRFGYDWFEDILDIATSATLKKRIKFINPKTMKQSAQAKTAQTLFCFGNSTIIENFIEEFKTDARIFNPSK